MSFRSTLFVIILLAGICAYPPPLHTADDFRKKVPHISAYKAYQLYSSGRIFLLDVHYANGKIQSQIVGALYLPQNKLQHVKLNIPKKMLIGVFCN